MARSHRRQAGLSLKQAEAALPTGAWGLTIRRSQETVELALKAALRHAGVETPKWHDVGDILKEHRLRFPTTFANRIDQFAGWSATLRERRELSLYGDETAEAGSDEVFTKDQATEALGWAREIVAAMLSVVT